ncbi:MAG: COX15/CtaA family protein [Planctomycetaceae bacterium]
MNSPKSQLWLNRMAISTACVAMVTILFGALTTTKDAGMAFPHWLYSDAYPMPLYPWLKDFGSNWNKFLEHGHRLAGMLIGLWSIALVVVNFRLEQRSIIRWMSVAVLLGVICQGILGGLRVEQNSRVLAMFHGAFAAVVVSLIASMAVATSTQWNEQGTTNVDHLKPWAVVIVLALAIQYLLGGLIRHRGTGLHEHLGMAVLAYLGVWVNAFIVHRSKESWLKRSAWMLVILTTTQVLLGLVAWLFKYGFAPWGFVPVMNSLEQLLARTVHSMFGILVFATSVVHALRVFRLAHLSQTATESSPVLFASPELAGEVS